MLTGVLTVTLPFLAIAWWLRWAAFVSADNADAGSVEEEHCVHAHLPGNDHEEPVPGANASAAYRGAFTTWFSTVQLVVLQTGQFTGAFHRSFRQF